MEIKYSREFAKKSFTSEDMKTSYLRAAKWYATNVLSKDELHNVLVEFEKDKQSPTVTIHLFATLNEKEMREQHCKCCEEMHRSFFINENNNCNICAARGYQNRIDERMSVKIDYYRRFIKGDS